MDNNENPRPGQYQIDTLQSEVRFRTRHMFGLSPVRGTFTIRSGTAEITNPVTGSAVHAEIATDSFTTGNGQRDTDVRSAKFLDAARFPVITFRDGKLSEDGTALRGTLTVQETSRPVSLAIGQVSVTEQEFTVTATVRVDRTEFGVTAMRGMAGRYLDLTIRARFVRE